MFFSCLMIFFPFQVSHILNVGYGVENIFPDLFVYKTLSILDLPETDITSYFHETSQFIDQVKAEVKCTPCVPMYWFPFLLCP